MRPNEEEEEDGPAQGAQEALLGPSSLTFPCLRALDFRVGDGPTTKGPGAGIPSGIADSKGTFLWCGGQGGGG